MPCESACSTSPDTAEAEPRFIMDFSMNKVAKYFRLLGYDTLCTRDVPQTDLIATATAEGRTLVTCSRPLVRAVDVHNRRVRARRHVAVGDRASVTRRVVAYDSDGESIYSEDPDDADAELRCLFTEQWRSSGFNRAMMALIQQAGLTYDPDRVFCRCVTCNEPLLPVAKAEVRGRVVEKIYEIYDEFTACPLCHKVFWGFDGENVINFKSFRTLSLLRSLCISAGAPVEEERTRLARLRCFRSFPRLTKVLIFSFMDDGDLQRMIEVFPALRDLAEEVQDSRRTGEPVRRLQLTKR
ncbi:Mut7-C RNAse domain containing protein [Novymonas esmeraldas]|uniref:Mut7-C RNAse domain containing protein n=1 Tax=Novymonas esmeraldas TaxID=1808958 RepID=A0AAW0F0T3_9TRYP